ncbi:Vsp/OspC family lipoprotein (plasmid) [Borrelia miyamotoi]|uniref:Vsp/OspC family lipoprotein n=1 Tax=Borrelia miyamotoi TaxID=47466 RepID=A0A5P8AVC2_9SPIR|nr:Vsp/OspC family lipoprotein [Borrelia miyamotoi]WAZ72582.1 Vsp/OspC family lipoprotein [Borrelia miyamotoi]WVI04723.1 Vsp/OspC family lipoprotein [Borrelia miyamotoi]WVI05468.1 Vsp/OspC family lipoprotein [Borrelia miyamotoi]
MSKRKTLSAIIMTLFLIINIVMISCGSGGPAEQSQATKADGTVIDLAKVSEKIKNAIAFAEGIKEVETLIKSIDEFVKGIGKKLKKDDGTLEAEDNGNNGQLVAGVYSLVSGIDAKLAGLEQKAGVSDELKAKIAGVKAKSKPFLDKLKDDDLCKKAVTDAHIKNAIDKNDNTGGKGKEELIALNASIDELLKGAADAVEAAITELTMPAKVATAKP